MANRARVKVKQKGVTRAQAVEEFGRKKAKLRRQHIKRRVLMGGGLALIAYGLVGSWWLVHTGKLQEAMEQSSTSFWQHTATVGFRVEQVTLVGRKHADAKEIKAALDIKQGAPILAMKLDDIKTRLLAIPEVKSVIISRTLPNQLTVAITERRPAAWWQVGGVQKLIDAEGAVLSRDKYKGKLVLPVVVGADAPQHVAELLALLETAPSLKPDVVAAVRIGQRRWNVQLVHDVVVMLPEEKPADAWKRFATLVEKEALLGKAIRSVDMRVEDRVFIMPLEQEKNPITLTTARDT